MPACRDDRPTGPGRGFGASPDCRGIQRRLLPVWGCCQKALLSAADTTNGPVKSPGRILNDVGFGDAVPGNRPSHGPAVSGAGHAAVHEIDPAVGDRTIVYEQTRGPALMGLNAAAVSPESGVKHHVGAGYQAGGPYKIGVAARAAAAVEQVLAAFESEITRFGGAE